MTIMESKNSSQISIDQPAQYRICVTGELEGRWSDRLGGMQIRGQTQGDGSIVTTLEGKLVDQAALFGVLVALYNMRLPLISVECLDTNREDESSLVKVKIEQKVNYLEFIFTGVQNAIQTPEPLETVLNSCKLAGLYRVLVDYRGLTGGNRGDPEAGYAQGVGRLYQEYLATGDLPLRIAVVGKEEMIEAWKQSEEIVRGYGLEALVTGDYEEAIAWLNSAPEVP
jgi:hypothetical protein